MDLFRNEEAQAPANQGLLEFFTANGIDFSAFETLFSQLDEPTRFQAVNNMHNISLDSSEEPMNLLAYALGALKDNTISAVDFVKLIEITSRYIEVATPSVAELVRYIQTYDRLTPEQRTQVLSYLNRSAMPQPDFATTSQPISRSKNSTKNKGEAIKKQPTLQQKLAESAIALLKDAHQPKNVNQTKALKDDLALRFDYLVNNAPDRAKRLLNRLREIALETPKPELSLEHLPILVGNIHAYTPKREAKPVIIPSDQVISNTPLEQNTLFSELQIDPGALKDVWAFKAHPSKSNQQQFKYFSVDFFNTLYDNYDFLKGILKDASGRSVLHWAAISGSLDMLKFMVNALNTLRNKHPKISANIPLQQSQDHFGNTVAHETAIAGAYNTNTARKPLNITFRGNAQKLEVNQPTSLTPAESELNTLLQYQSIECHTQRNQLGMLPLHLAMDNNNCPMFDQLMLNTNLLDIDQDLHQNTGMSALHFAALNAAVEIDTLKHIADQTKISVNQPDAEGYTPLHYAAATGNLPAQLFLLSRGADPLAKSRNGDTPLTLALSVMAVHPEDSDPSQQVLVLIMSTRIKALNALFARAGLDPHYPQRVIKPQELLALDTLQTQLSEQPNHNNVFELSLPEQKNLALAGITPLVNTLQRNGKNHRLSEAEIHAKTDKRMREYVLAPIAFYHGKGAAVRAQEEDACKNHLPAQQRLHCSMLYADFHTNQVNTIDKDYLLPYGVDSLQAKDLEVVKKGFVAALKTYISISWEPWVEEPCPAQNNGRVDRWKRDANGSKIASWGQWLCSTLHPNRHYKAIAEKIINKIEDLEQKDTITKEKLLDIIDSALRKADLQLRRNEGDSNVSGSDFRLRCLTAQAMTLQARENSADLTDNEEDSLSYQS